MNKAYRTIWNESSRAWTAVQENARGRGKRSTRKALALAVAAIVTLGMAGTAMATPAPGNNGGNTGIFVNDQSTGGCIAAYDATSGSGGGTGNQWYGINASNYSGQLKYCSADDKATQTTRVLFYGSTSGPNAQAGGQIGTDSLTIGDELYVNGGRIVLNNQITGTNSLAIGDESTLATGTNGVAIGNGAQSSGASAASLGTAAQASATDAVAIGHGASASSVNSVALGANSGTSMNLASPGTAYNPNALFVLSGLTPVGEVSVGTAGNERRVTNVAAGSAATDAVNVSQLQSLASTIEQANVHYYSVVGTGSSDGNYNNDGATAPGAMAFGVNARAGGENATAGGTSSTATGDEATALGYNASATGPRSTALGEGAVASDYWATALGGHASASGIGSVAVGESVANANWSTAVGTHSQAGAARATAIGADAKAMYESSLAAGQNAQANGISAVALGHDAAATTNSVALGAKSQATRGALTDYTDATGKLTHQNSTGEVNVGGRQMTGVAAGTAGTDAVNVNQLQAATEDAVTYDTPDHDSVTLGGNGATSPVRLHNVAAGDLGVDSTDAVNGSQLYQTNQNVTNLDNRVTTVEGDVTTLGDTVNDIYATGTKYFHANSTGTDSQALGSDSVAIGMGAVANNTNDVALGAGSVTSNAVGTTGAVIGGMSYTFAGAVPNGTVSVGSAGNERTVTNVAAGQLNAGSTDAVNGSQLYATNQAVNANTKAINQNTSDITNLQGDVANAVMYDSPAHDSVTLGGSGATSPVHLRNVAAGDLSEDSTDAVNGSQLYQTNQNVTNLDNRVTTVEGDVTTLGDTVNNIYGGGTKYFHANSTGADSQALGSDSVAIGMGAVARNANDVALGAGSVTSNAVGTAGAYFGGQYYAFAGGNPTSTVSVGAAGSERTVTNVAAGQVSATSTDAVNGSQLYAVGEALGDLSSTVNNVAQGAVKYDTNPDGTTNYNSITLNGGDGGTVIQNVGAGTTGTDAVNLNQLNQALSGVSENIAATANPFFTGNGNRSTEAAVASGTHATAMGAGASASAANSVALGAGSVADRANTVSVGTAGNERQITNVAPGSQGTDAVNLNQLNATGAQANQYTDQRVNALGSSVNQVARDAYSGVAAATALTMIPDVDLGKTLALGVGVGTYRGYQAMAIGGTARITQNIKLKAGAGLGSGGGTTVGVGGSYQW